MAMTNFHIVRILRSDGCRSFAVGKNKFEDNGPKPEQLSKAPKTDKNGNEVYDYYQQLGPNDAKYKDWCVKLGGLIIRDFGKPEEKQYINCSMLSELPENYRLFEHIKTRPANAEKSSKAHAGGGHDRQDAYLYGHPGGRRQRFRSPGEFVKHLGWLRGDDWDPDNCTCKLCAHDDLQAPKPKRRVAKVEIGKPEVASVPTAQPAMQPVPHQLVHVAAQPVIAHIQTVPHQIATAQQVAIQMPPPQQLVARQPAAAQQMQVPVQQMSSQQLSHYMEEQSQLMPLAEPGFTQHYRYPSPSTVAENPYHQYGHFQPQQGFAQSLGYDGHLTTANYDGHLVTAGYAGHVPAAGFDGYSAPGYGDHQVFYGNPHEAFYGAQIPMSEMEGAAVEHAPQWLNNPQFDHDPRFDHNPQFDQEFPNSEGRAI